MRCFNCGKKNDKETLQCSNCGADLSVQKPKDILKNKKILIMLSVISITVIVVIVAILATVIFPNVASARMRNAFESKFGANVIDIFVDYCGDYSVVYDDLSRSGKAVFNEFEDCIKNAKDDLNEQSVDTDINNYLLETTGDIFIPQNYSAATTICQYNGELYNAVQDFYLLYSSKISYKIGIIAYSEADYSTAVSELSSVIESDSWYEDAQSKLTECQEKLLEEKLTLIDNYINIGDYDSALQQVNSLRNENLTDEMKAELDEYEAKIYETQLSKIEDYINDGDIEGAKEYVESLGANLSDDAQARLEQVLKSKADEYLTKADEALKSGERQGAYDMAVMAQTLCPDDAEIQKKVEYYKEYLPFALYKEENCLSQEKEEYYSTIQYDSKLTSNNSKTMQNCIRIGYENTSSGLLFSVTYNLDGNYDKLSGTQFVTADSKSIEQNAYFEIYGDGKKLFTSDTMGVNYLPKNFSVDISGISILNVKFYGDTNFSSLMLDLVHYGVSDFVATKNLPE